MGLDQEKRFHRYHRVLSRARWSSLKASRVLLGLLVEAFVPEGDPLVVGIDETLERRYGKKIAARGVYRDPVRSTHETFVKSSGLRWVWALPFLSALAPSKRYAAKRGRRHKKITEWAWQLLLVLRCWYPQREIVAVADALALVRKELWAQEQTFCGSPAHSDTVKVPRAYLERLTDAVCYAA